ncbi:8-amino-7-oxononanoate synthase [Shewanella sp. UCD-KL12]|uniref:aminotransferase class I/II-fold pyridoxal phosphate-dependent enzyme n=1 Tax=Shewanella sp. UCD-KL12 TaxID=1917163 RepID=UPI00097092A0|nr:8-amino-7-oxononanoate synthase [Shewanella sp. UCD-KL12]
MSEAHSLTDKLVKHNAKVKQLGLLRERKRVNTCVHEAQGEGSDNSSVSGKLPSKMQFTHEGREYVNFSSNDYLGLSRSAQLIEAQHQSAISHGVGSGSSPLVTGYSDVHLELEQALCQSTGHEAALLFCSGFSANTALMKTLFGKGDFVVADKLVHASIIDGLKDSETQFKRFIHNDMDSAKALLTKHKAQAIVTESIFSMDGDIAPLSSLSKLCQQHGAWLIVDDAHGYGILPTSLISAETVDVQVVTFGKALGCQGAAVLGSQVLIDFLVSNAREYIYSTALSPSSAATALAAVQLVSLDKSRASTLNENIQYFRQQCVNANLKLNDSTTAIQPLIIGEADDTLRVANQLKCLGIWVGAIRPPTVPKGTARLRVTLTALHTHQEIDRLINGLKQVMCLT